MDASVVNPDKPGSVATALRRVLRPRMKRETRQGHILLCLALWSTLSFLAISRFVYSTVVVEGRSMMPTLQPGERHLLNHWLPRLVSYQRGDLVVLQEGEGGPMVVKRIIARPHETIQLRDDGVYVNGRILHEPYVPKGMYTYSRRMEDRVLTLKSDQYFVMGDNRFLSLDSRWYGPVTRSELRGTLAP